jgi:hypothetical protein
MDNSNHNSPSTEASEATEREPMTLAQEIDRVGEHTPRIAELLRKAARYLGENST